MNFFFSSPYSNVKFEEIENIDPEIKIRERDEIIVKLEKELEHSKNVIKILDERAGPSIVDDDDTVDESDNEVLIEHEVPQIDEQFSGHHIYTTNVSNIM